jgi:glycine betaine transporter
MMPNIWHSLGLDRASRGERALFLLSIGILLVMAVVGIVWPSLLSRVMNNAFDFVLKYFGWWFMLSTAILAVIMIGLALSKYSTVKIGGPDAEPEFDLFSWFAMVFTVSFGSVVVFWGVAEPISIVTNPPDPVPVQGASIKSIALAFMFLHNILPGLLAWYLPVALAFGLIVYGGDDYKISSMLTPLLDREKYGYVYWITDLAALVAIIGGLATTLGFTGVQLRTILANVYGIQGSGITYLLFGVIGLIFFVDIWLGLRDGIRNMARLTIVLICILFGFLFVIGPTLFMVNLGIDAVGIWLGNIIRLTLYTAPVSDGTWVQEWSSFWFAWWCAWGIFVGSFIARVSKGRTLREVTGVVVVIPSIFLVIQHSILAGWALTPGNLGPISKAYAEGGNPAALTKAINITPYSDVIGLLFALVLVGYVVTSLDSAAYILSSLNLGEEDPNGYNRAIWGIVLAFFGIMTLELPGTRAIESFSAVLALPFTIFFFVIVYATYIVAKQRYNNTRRKRVESRQVEKSSYEVPGDQDD